MPLEVLYLDDEVDLAELFAEEFSSSQIRVTAVNDVEQAIQICNTNPPDVIFLDFRLPGTTGDLVALRLPAQIPKYLITGDTIVKTNYSFKAIFRKPIDRSQIHKVLETHRH